MRIDAQVRSREFIATLLVWSVAALVVGAFLFMVGDMLWIGVGQISWVFLTQAPMDAGRQGGIGSILAATLAILAIAMSVALPIAVGTGALLGDVLPREHRIGIWVRRSLDVLAGMPSIVIGLFGNAFFCVALGLGFSILAGGLTLACMALPLMIRAAEEGFRGVPSAQRQAAAALGLSRYTTLVRISLPLALPAIVAGLLLGIGRAMAESAALIFTSGYVDRMPESPLDSGRALAVHIFDLSMNVPGGDRKAYASVVVLLALLLIINTIARTFMNRWLGNVGANT